MKMIIAGNKCTNCKHYKKVNYIYSKVRCIKRNKYYISMHINYKDFENIEEKTMKQNKGLKINIVDKKQELNLEEHKVNIELHLSLLEMPYWDKRKIKWGKHNLGYDRLILMFPMPRNSVYTLVEFCKLNGINISYDCQNINLDFVNGFKQNYDKVI